MNRIYKLILLFYVCYVIFLFISMSEASEQTHRQKRYLGFRNVSHFFIRLNFKANMVPWNQIFAQALGFRAHWDDPHDNFFPHRLINRRSVYRNLEILLDRNGLDGFHCVRRAMCEINQIDKPNLIYFKLLKIIFRQYSLETQKWHNHTDEDCQLSINVCPFSLLEISSYTDL